MITLKRRSPCSFCGQPVGDPGSLIEARLRLGAWLSAEPGRSWDSETEGVIEPVEWTVRLLDAQDFPNGEELGVGGGPDLASAIVAALEKANT